MLARFTSLVCLTTLWLMGSSSAGVIQLVPVKDNTLIQQTDPARQRSNALGDLFVGRTGQDGMGAPTVSIRRGLVAFDIAASIPAGSTVTAVSLTMRDVMGQNGDPTITLHRVRQEWGSGTSFQNGGQGAPATAGDSTWLYRFFDPDVPAASPVWSTPGGDFEPAASASLVITDDSSAGEWLNWTSTQDPQLLVDVQSWLDNPSENFGWLLRGEESVGFTATRFNSSESTAPPLLLITYVVPETSGLPLFATVSGLLLVHRRGRRRGTPIRN